jgi:hypothetical protein
MNELIKQAAEDCYGNETYSQPISKEVRIGRYHAIITHFLSFIKKKGVELVRVEGDVYSIIEGALPSGSSGEVSQVIIDIAKESYALGAAKERERMMKAMEWVVDEMGLGCVYDRVNNVWQNRFDKFHRQTTEEAVSELIEIFNTQNKEG